MNITNTNMNIIVIVVGQSCSDMMPRTKQTKYKVIKWKYHVHCLHLDIWG